MDSYEFDNFFNKVKGLIEKSIEHVIISENYYFYPEFKVPLNYEILEICALVY